MWEFEAKKPRSAYKSDWTYLRAVYLKNKKVIDSAFEQEDSPVSPYITLRQIVKEFKEEGKSTQEALNTLRRSSYFMTRAEHIRINAVAGLKGDADAYKRFMQLNRDEKGHYAKFDPDKLFWDYNERAYVYDNKITITYRSSPYGIVVSKLSKDQASDINYNRDSEYYGPGRRKTRSDKGRQHRRRREKNV